MKKVDFIVVGCGLAGIAFCEQLKKHNKTFVVFDDQSQKSSIVAAGLYNPVVLKRFTEVWKAKEQLELAVPFYKNLEQLLQVTLDYNLPIYRCFSSIEEQNEWFIASDKPHLEPYLSTTIIKNENPFITAPFGFGKVLQTGKIDTSLLLQQYKNRLKQENRYVSETFDYQALKTDGSALGYKNFTSTQIVFAEGFGMVQNPFFKELPLNVAKGEIVTIKAPNLKMDYVLKSSIFIIPEGDDVYSVGATYNWKDKTHDITEEAKVELFTKLKRIITCDFEVIRQVAGIRPTVIDRRPLVGTHLTYKNFAILNGLGTRGVMLAPFLASELFEHIENGKPLEKEIDINRFKCS